MPMQNTFPIRQGLSVPRGENLQSVEVFCEGGLDLSQTIIEAKPGASADLVNFEVGLKGGYRRLSGFDTYTATIVPGQGEVLGVAAYLGGKVVAMRRDSGGGGANYSVYEYTAGWNDIDDETLTYTAGMVIQNTQYNWTGTPRIVFVDGTNPAYKWDGTTFTKLNAAGSPTNPKFALEFKGYLVLGGYTSNKGAIKFSAVLDDTVWNASGALEVVIGDEITGLGSWRGRLIIFARTSIWNISGSSTDPASTDPFKLEPITRRIGCVEGRSIQECNGDLLFLAQDGVRTISGTANIGDTEISSITRPIQDIVSTINPTLTPVNSVVVRRKTQYRLFYTNPNSATNAAQGVLLGIRRFRDGKEGWEAGELLGIKPSCCHSSFFPDGQEYVLFGGYDGYVYRMETGSSFKYVGANIDINESYVTVPLDFGDYTLRKSIQRVTVYFYAEGSTLQMYLAIRYDHGKASIIQPLPYLINTSGFSTVVYDGGFKYDDGKAWDTAIFPIARQLVQGSGFITQFKFSSISSDPYVIIGFNVEYFPAGRR